jgi:hypothetical protein
MVADAAVTMQLLPRKPTLIDRTYHAGLRLLLWSKLQQTVLSGCEWIVGTQTTSHSARGSLAATADSTRARSWSAMLYVDTR